MVSPTFAVTSAGLNAKLAIDTATVPADCATAHGAPPAAAEGASDSAWDAGAADGAVVAVLPPPQAATTNSVPNRNVLRMRVRDMVASALRARWCLGYIDGYAGIRRPVSTRAA